MIVISCFDKSVDEVSKNQKGKVTLLPEELLVHIFSYLDCQGQLNAERVCKDWCVIQKKYEGILDGIWGEKWFKSHPEPYVKYKHSWKIECLNDSRWICNNSIAYYLNTTNSVLKISHIESLDDRVSLEKCTKSIGMISVLGLMSCGMSGALPVAMIAIPALMLRAASSICETIVETKFSVIDDTTDSLLDSVLKVVFVTSVPIFLYLFITIQISATKGIRKNCLHRISKYLRND